MHNEDYDINDEGCYRIRHLEEELYRNYIPKKYKTDDVISYQWHQNREHNLQGQFNFYYNKYPQIYNLYITVLVY